MCQIQGLKHYAPVSIFSFSYIYINLCLRGGAGGFSSSDNILNKSLRLRPSILQL